MKIAIRVDCSNEIGMGHIMRCLAIATKASSLGHDVLFIGNDIPSTFVERIINSGCKVDSFALSVNETSSSNLKHSNWLKGGTYCDALETSKVITKYFGIADWLIVDHYGIDIEWESKLRRSVRNIAVIDDLADREHDADLLLDQNIYDGWSTKYKKLTPSDCKLLVGSSYILLRDEFISLSPLPIGARRRDLIIFMGGGDEFNYTGKLLELLIESDNRDKLKVDVIIGPINSHKNNVERLMQFLPHGRLFVNPTNIAELYLNSRLAIGAPGGSTWERCCLGVPSVLVAIADNQLRVGRFLDNEGIAWLACSVEQAITRYYEVSHDAALLSDYSCRAQCYVDGKGVERFITQLEKVFNNV
ncbi:UDP-2,4-diacetamido-2,4,6-trideoxy-beta-L-altropyranose hydrolase [Vibrio sp. 10N.247.311.51]|uniref:UDP-2,4-diacetamido-2,4, 6-trideoxy-beta-L-altropyranose hydrolase n=1 Tax=Vibrio sp. 10N.247.311.51 TaxID=3229996 RepID=UPI0035507F0B